MRVDNTNEYNSPIFPIYVGGTTLAGKYFCIRKEKLKEYIRKINSKITSEYQGPYFFVQTILK